MRLLTDDSQTCSSDLGWLLCWPHVGGKHVSSDPAPFGANFGNVGSKPRLRRRALRLRRPDSTGTSKVINRPLRNPPPWAGTAAAWGKNMGGSGGRERRLLRSRGGFAAPSEGWFGSTTVQHRGKPSLHERILLSKSPLAVTTQDQCRLT